MGKARRAIQTLEKELKEQLESTCLLTNVHFYVTQHYFEISYKPFNHENVRTFISECCKQTLEKIMKNNPAELVHIQELDEFGIITKQLILNSISKPDKVRVGYKILEELKKDLANYMETHKSEIEKYQRMIRGRTG